MNKNYSYALFTKIILLLFYVHTSCINLVRKQNPNDCSIRVYQLFGYTYHVHTSFKHIKLMLQKWQDSNPTHHDCNGRQKIFINTINYLTHSRAWLKRTITYVFTYMYTYIQTHAPSRYFITNICMKQLFLLYCIVGIYIIRIMTCVYYTK